MSNSFHQYIYIYKRADIELIKGRLRFEVKGIAGNPAPFPSMIVRFHHV